MRQENGLPAEAPVPIDAVTAVAAASTRKSRCPMPSPDPWHRHARGVPEAAVRNAIQGATRGHDLGFLGKPRLNVLEANLALDGKHL